MARNGYLSGNGSSVYLYGSTAAGNAEQNPPAAFLTGHTKEYVQVKLPLTAGHPGGIVQTIITPEMILLSGTDT